MNTQQKLVELFKKFPTVGSRTAGRFVYYLMKLPKERIDEIINAILEVKNKIKLCALCFQPFEAGPVDGSTGLCALCADTKRNKNLLCIVEKESDLLSLESTKKFNGLYFILGGTVGTMRKEEISQLRIEQLKKRLKDLSIQSGASASEIIIALNSTPEGRTTSVLVEQTIRESFDSAQDLRPSPKITHLAKGLPVGGELEYADEETLESALEGRK
ncbi:MAG: toprim domain-containing protein [Candidatus Staskawiczbacteria bacterium]|nr:toprim domain-containing protein [Candidatus Staskawiczbacteria bacterium]